MNARFLWGYFASLSFVSSLWGYDIQMENGHPVTWDAGTVTMKLLLSSTPVLSDGSTYVSSVQTALDTWNSQIYSVQFASTPGLPVSPANNTVNEIAFDSTVYGTAFDANVLAITVFYYSTNNPRGDGSYRRTQADLVFNAAYTWDSYRGPLRSSQDIQRVALHELGHVLGLNHPDEANPPQSVSAQMNSHVSNLDTLAADDSAGAQFLYGAPQSVPKIINQPANQSIYSGQSAQFSLGAIGNPTPDYRWQRLPSGNGNWSDLSDGGSYSGSGTSTLTVANSLTSMSGDQFRCVVTNAKGTVVSDAAFLAVTASSVPTITGQPLSQITTEGSSVTFSVTADGIPAPVYQWRKNDINIAGATGSSYTISAVSPADGGSYTVMVTNLAGSTLSNAAVLSVAPLPLITSLSSTRQVLSLGDGLNLSVTATGTGVLNYQWVHGGRPIAGATGASYAISSAGISDGGWYVVLVTDTKGTRRSAPIFVIMKPSATTSHIVGWGNNSFGQITVPAGLTNAVAVAANNNESLALKADGSVVGWGQQAPAPDGLSSVVAIAVGTFHSVALKADGTVVSWGDSSYGLSSTAAGLTNVVAVTAGYYYSLALKADSTVFAWGDTSSSYHQTEVPAGLTNVVAIAGSNVSSLALKSDGTVVGWGSNLAGEANVPAGLNNVVAIATGTDHSLALKADGTVAAWGGDAYGQATVPAGLTGVVAIAASGSVSFALKEDGTVVSWGNDSSGQFTLPQNRVPFGLKNVTAIAGGWQHTLALCSGPIVAPVITMQPASLLGFSGSSVSFTVVVGGSAPFTFKWQRMLSGGTWMDVGADGSAATLAVSPLTAAMNGDEYRCIVTNSVGSTTSNAATLSVVNGPGAPVIVGQPLPTTVATGLTAIISVAATGSNPLFYVWQTYDGNAKAWLNVSATILEVFSPPSYYVTPSPPVYTGYYSASLQINTSAAIVSGPILNGKVFRCLVTNLEGSATSNSVTLMVLPLPLFTMQPLSQAVLVGGQVTMAGGANSNPAATYQWQRDGSDIVGATSATLTLTNIQATDAGSYVLVATNAYGSVISTPAVLVIISSVGTSDHVLGDFDGDRKADLIWTNSVTGERSMWFLNGNALSGGASLGVVPVAWVVSATSDFDGDGKADIFWTNTATGDRAIWLMNGSTMLTNTFMGTVSPDWVISGTGDFNGDGKADLVWTNTVNGDRAMWLMNGSTVLGGGYLGTVPVEWTISGVGDFNGDGKADLVWSNTVTGERSMWFQNGSTTTGGATLNTVPVAWVITGVGDFNADGKADVFLTNTTTGDRVIWLMNGSMIVTNAFMGTVPVEWTISGTGDFNGDKKKDLFWTNTETGDRAVWLLNGSTVLGGGFMGTVPVIWTINN